MLPARKTKRLKLVRDSPHILWAFGISLFCLELLDHGVILGNSRSLTCRYWNTEREVKKATRDLNQLLSNIESPMTRLETVHKKYTELLADMKKLDRDHTKSKKRADQLQKDQDKGKSDLSKTITMKDKLEKLCRELTKENKKVKVGLSGCAWKGLRQTPWRNRQLNVSAG
jgi:DNA repair ATPase RecN